MTLKVAGKSSKSVLCIKMESAIREISLNEERKYQETHSMKLRKYSRLDSIVNWSYWTFREKEGLTYRIDWEEANWNVFSP